MPVLSSQQCCTFGNPPSGRRLLYCGRRWKLKRASFSRVEGAGGGQQVCSGACHGGGRRGCAVYVCVHASCMMLLCVLTSSYVRGYMHNWRNHHCFLAALTRRYPNSSVSRTKNHNTLRICGNDHFQNIPVSRTAHPPGVCPR